MIGETVFMTLPSNVSFSTNTASKFKVKLNPRRVLYGPHWFVGMKSIALPPLTLESRMAPLVGLDHSVPITTLEKSIILMKTSWYKYNGSLDQMQQGSAAVALHQVANATDGVSFMKAMLDFTEWMRTKHGSLAITSDAGKTFYYEDPNDGSKYLTYLKWVWEKVGDEQELFLDNNDVWMDDPPQLWFHVNLAQAMGWLTKSSQGQWVIGPNLRLEWKDDKIEDVSQDTTLQDVVDESNNPCFWVVENHQGSDYLQLSQAVNWRFLNLNAAFQKLSISDQPRRLHLFSNVALSAVVGEEKKNLLSEVIYGKESTFFEPRHVEYHRVKTPYLDVLEFELREMNGNAVHFGPGATFVTLHFIQKE